MIQSRSRLVFEEKKLRMPGVHSLGQYHYTSAEPGLPLHQHKGCVEISFLAKGYQAYQVAGKLYHVKGGEQYVSVPGEVHDTGDEPEEKGIMYWLILDVTKYRDDFLFLAPQMANRLITDLSQLPSRHFPASAESRATLDKAFAALLKIRTPDECTGIFQTGGTEKSVAPGAKNSTEKKAGESYRLLEAASHLIYYILQTIQSSRAQGRQISPVIQASLNFIARNEDTCLNVASVAEEVHLSESNFKMRFREEIGVPPAEYMLHEKIEIAKARLGKPGATITDVAFSLGFSSSQYFATVFKRFTKRTPSEFLKGRPTELARIVD